MVDQSNDMEAIGHNARVRKVFLDNGSIYAGQIHAYHAHLCFAFQTRQIGRQGEFRAAQHHIVNLVVAQIAKRGGVAFAAGEKVLVDAEHGRAARRMPFRKLALQAMLKMALDGRGANAFAAAQPAAIDAVQVLLKDRLAEGLARSSGRAEYLAAAGATACRSLDTGTCGLRFRASNVADPRFSWRTVRLHQPLLCSRVPPQWAHDRGPT